MNERSAFFDKIVLIRQIARRLFADWSEYIILAAKLAVALLVFYRINAVFPYRPMLCRGLVVWSVALLSSVLPWGLIPFFGAVFLLGQLSALSLEAAAFVLVLILVLAVVKYLMLPGCSIVLVLLPLLCSWKLAFVIPLMVGLTGGLTAFISVGSGLSLYYVLQLIKVNEAFLKSGTAGSVKTLLFLVKGLLENKEMLLMMACFCFTTLLVYVISHLDLQFCHFIALVIGAVFDLVLVSVCFSFAKLSGGLGMRILASILGLLLALVYDFYRSALKYSGTERVQFEDDDYYYYVKAIPKVKLPDDVVLPPAPGTAKWREKIDQKAGDQ